MKKALSEFSQNGWRPGTWLFTGLAAALLATGCARLTSLPLSYHEMGPAYKPSNIYGQTDPLPATVRRVALLPLSGGHSGTDMESGIETLEPVVNAELAKTKRFEVIPVSATQMRQWFGQGTFRADEQLPLNFFAHLHEETGCDAVFFCHLTRYQPYQPVSIGWKLTLVQNPRGTNAVVDTTLNAGPRILWSADEVLDAGNPEISNGARAYYSQHLRTEGSLADSATVLNSPERFGQYGLSLLMGTLPERSGRPK